MRCVSSDQIAVTRLDNFPSLRIYENLGFLRTKRLHRYYLNGNTAFRLVLYLKPGVAYTPTYPPEMVQEEDGSVVGSGLTSEDLLARQATQMQIEDIHSEKHDVTGR